MLRAVMFDLDGTLLPMDQEKFIKCYFGTLAMKMAEKGIDPQKITKAIMVGTEAMILNDGKVTNEECFWQVFEKEMGMNPKELEDDFNEFYINDFIKAKQACGFNPHSKEVVEIFKEKGYRLICATNPLFPEIATFQRIQWAGLEVKDFEWITTFEKCKYCKPNIEYYQEILNHCNLSADEVIMIGNDIQEDMVVRKLNIKANLITDNLINKNNDEIEAEFVGTMKDFKEYIKQHY